MRIRTEKKGSSETVTADRREQLEESFFCFFACPALEYLRDRVGTEVGSLKEEKHKELKMCVSFAISRLSLISSFTLSLSLGTATCSSTPVTHNLTNEKSQGNEEDSSSSSTSVRIFLETSR